VEELLMVDDPDWVDAGGGYAVAIDPAGTVLCRNAKGALQRAVPAAVRKSPAGQQAVLAGDWLAWHTRDCLATVERWLVRSLPVPAGVVAGVWADPAWRAALRNAVVVVADRCGLLREADPARGVALLDPTGTTTWHAGGTLLVPHPVLLPEPAAFRKLLSELGDRQEVAQLYRDVFTRPSGAPGWWYDAFAGVEVERLSTLTSVSTRLGYQVRQGWATCRVWEGGRRIEAQFLLGEGDPAASAETGSIIWRVGRGELLRLGDVGPIAWSEGVRMAALCLGRAPAEPTAVSAAPAAAAAERGVRHTRWRRRYDRGDGGAGPVARRGPDRAGPGDPGRAGDRPAHRPWVPVAGPRRPPCDPVGPGAADPR
jgi:hypothetical protein